MACRHGRWGVATMRSDKGPLVICTIVARALKIRDPRTVRAWIVRGTVIGELIGRSWYVRRDEYDRLKMGEPAIGRPPGWKAPEKMRRSYT